MTAWLFVVAMQMQGTVWALLARRDVGIPFCVFAGLPLGVLGWVTLDLLALLTPLPSSRAFVFGVYAALFGAGAFALARSIARHGPFRPRDLVELGGWIAALAVFAAIFTFDDFTVTSPDSLVMLDAGRSFVFFGAFDDGGVLASRGVLTTVLLGSSIQLGEPYLPALFPSLALSLAGIFVTVGARGLGIGGQGSTPMDRARHLALSIGACCALFAPYFMLVHAFYLHSNLAAAVYLFGFAACFWLAERSGARSWLVLAFVFLGGFSLTRVEAPMVALLMIAIAFARSEVDERALARCTSAFLLPLFAWQLVVWWRVGDESSLVGSRQIAVMAALILAAIPGLVLLRVQALRPLRSRLAWLAVAALVTALAGAAIFDGTSLLESSRALATNATGIEWGGLWLAIGALGVGALFRPPVPAARLFGLAGLAYLLLILLMAPLRGAPYNVAWQDSGNRMLVHVAPMLMFWLLLAYAPGFDAQPRLPRPDVPGAG